MTHVIKKTYEGYPSQNKVEFEGTHQGCKDYLKSLISLSKKHGADIVSESDEHYACANYDSNGATVTFEIYPV